MMQKYLNALWELTKRELRRKYARSYLGILWSVVYPFLRMTLVVIVFSSIFNKGIDNYPAYYFIGYLFFELYRVGTITSVTALRDNKDLLIKSHLQSELFVLSRIFTAVVNMILGFIPYIGILIYYKIRLTLYAFLIVPIIVFLCMFVIGVSYLLAIIYVYFKDIRNIHLQLVSVIKFFCALFYAIDWVAPQIRFVIEHNPLYIYIYAARRIIIYSESINVIDLLQIAAIGIITYIIGKLVFCINKNGVIAKL